MIERERERKRNVCVCVCVKRQVLDYQEIFATRMSVKFSAYSVMPFTNNRLLSLRRKNWQSMKYTKETTWSKLKVSREILSRYYFLYCSAMKMHTMFPISNLLWIPRESTLYHLSLNYISHCRYAFTFSRRMKREVESAKRCNQIYIFVIVSH